MNISNFIYVKENALSAEDCEALITESKVAGEQATRSSEGDGFGDSQFPTGKLGREDHSIFMPQQSRIKLDEVISCAFDGLEEYKHVISSVKTQRLISDTVKLQHTPVGGGFHEWHCEQGGGTSAARSLVWMIYLNDVYDGGDTEFLYQQIKVQPKQGTLVIWPAGITHPHRGNPPYSNDKWIVTGWFEVPMYDVYQNAIAYFKAAQ